jgi:hypothetical protein
MLEFAKKKQGLGGLSIKLFKEPYKRCEKRYYC